MISIIEIGKSKVRVDKKYDVEAVLYRVTDKCANHGIQRAKFDGHMVNFNSLRLKCFKLKGLNCVTCGVKGQFFYKEKVKNDEFFHWNLYGINAHGHEILLTKDHITPKSKGGPDHLDNLQTMCTKCNSKKGDKCSTNLSGNKSMKT